MNAVGDFGDLDGALSDFYALVPDTVEGVENLAEKASVKGAFATVWEWLAGGDDTFLQSLVFLFGITLFLILAKTLTSDQALSGVTGYALSVIFAVSLFSVLAPVITTATESLTASFDFFSAVTPFLYTVELSGGGTANGRGLYLGMQTLLWLMEWLLTVFQPFLSLLCALSLVSFLSPASQKLSRTLGKVLTVFLCFVGVVFSAVMTFQTFLQTAADSATLRLTKYTLSQMIPVVGSSVSASVSSLAAALSYLKSTVGGVGIYVMAVLLAPTVLRLFVMRAMLSFLLCLLPDGKNEDTGSILASFSSVLDTTLAFFVFSLFLYIFSFVLFVMSGVAIAR